MSRRPVVRLTPQRSIPDSSLFCTFCTLLQKSEAHPIIFQLFARSLQKHRGCHQERFFQSSNFELFHRLAPTLPSASSSCTVLSIPDHENEAHPLPFQSLAHSFAKTPGWPPPSTVSYRMSNYGRVNPFRINTYKSVSKQSTLTTFRINTYVKHGGGGAWKVARLVSLGASSGLAQPPRRRHCNGVREKRREPKTRPHEPRTGHLPRCCTFVSWQRLVPKWWSGKGSCATRPRRSPPKGGRRAA
jgi:hypothetical protein